MTSDRINPMVVKELRQGLKSRGFVSCFLSLQALLVISMVIYALNPSDLSFANGLFWLMTALVLLIFLPARATVAVLTERRQQTLELIQLTHLRAHRIIMGKWLSLSLQTLLVVTTLLPYLVARYFFGSLNLAMDLQAILLITLLSLSLGAGAVGLSAIPGRWTRNTVLWPLMMFLGVICLAFLDEWGMSSWLSVPAIAIIVLFVLSFLFFSLHFGSAQIGTGSHNHALPKRLIALLLPIGVTAISTNFSVGDEYLLLLVYLFSGFMMIDALSEPLPSEQPCNCRSGIPFFTPGYRSALGTLALLFLILWICGGVMNGPDPIMLFPLNFINMLLLPPAIQSCTRNRPANRLLFNVGLQFVCFGGAVFLLILSEIGGNNILSSPVCGLLPPLNLIRWLDRSATGFPDGVVTLFMTSVLLGLVLTRMPHPLRRESA